MLKQRILTAAILIPIFVALLLWLPPLPFNCLMVAFVLLGAWEWSNFMGVKRKLARLAYVLIVFGLLPLAFATSLVLCSAFMWWLLAFVLVCFYPKMSGVWSKSIVLRSLMGVFVFVPTFCALNFIRHTDIFGANQGPFLLLFLFVLIWGADSGAYFAGKQWGKHKLAPSVSPGKTWEGFAGALLTTVLVAAIGMSYEILPQASWAALMLLSVVTTLFSILGDLFESMLKRNVGLKDSGTLFPGHGGLLDRIDSLTAAAPIFALGCLLILKNHY